MAYRVKDALELSIRINNLEYPIDRANVVNFLHMAASTKFQVPTLHFSVTDITRSMSAMGLADGVPIQIIVTCDGQVTSRNFRLNTWVNPPGTDVYSIDGFWDAPKFRVGTTNKSLHGTTNKALSDIAATCGLAYSGTTTNDTQLWVPRNRTWAEFAAYVARHGYISDQSHLVSAIDSQGTFRFKDVRKPEKSFLGSYGYVADRAYRVEEYAPVVKSGQNNTRGGYRSTRINTSISQGHQTQDQLAFTPSEKKLLVSGEIRDIQKRGVFAYSPINFGNTHDNFDKALYQNRRFDYLRSLACEFLIFNPTLIEPLDEFLFTTSPSAPGEYDGSYMISHKVIYIQGNNYVEKLTGLREGLS